jgi:hypothetical protein
VGIVRQLDHFAAFFSLALRLQSHSQLVHWSAFFDPARHSHRQIRKSGAPMIEMTTIPAKKCSGPLNMLSIKSSI